MATGAELTYTTNASALQMANEIFGDGVTVVSATYTGATNSSAIYSRGDARSPDATPGDTGVILSTGNAASFTQSNGDPNRSTSTSTDTTGPNNDALFNALAGSNTYDASILSVDFVPTGDTLTMQFVFSSEEYPEYINSIYNDLVGVWVNGSPVEMAIGDTSVTGINGANNQNLYINNTTDAYNTEMDGFTVTMTLKMAVIPGQVNTLRIGIADVGDAQYDSNLLIAGNSVQAALIANDDAVTLAPGQSKVLDVLANDSGPGGSTLSITHINGQAVSAGSTITLATGQQITLNADGTLTILGDADTETVNFTYTVANGGGSGLSDVAYVTVNQVPCFVTGTRIATPGGMVPVESLNPGDLVLTHDEGAQPLRWVGRRQVAAEGNFAPIRIAAGTFGRHGELWLSPQHRVLVRDALAELLFGNVEVLVAAKDLVNGTTVTRVEGGMVDYVHILFDRHQLIWSEGLASESFLPGPQVMRGLDAPMVAEIRALFPELDPHTGQGYSQAARPLLRSFEAQVLFARAEAA